ncbi:MAG TPA: gluconokinase, GntK/IdnK-type [Polyangia bacterium]|nr:gluconokinase, GntK/IdnK-type [Polyangia bacterium]
MVIVVMGVAGAGKTTVGRALAAALDVAKDAAKDATLDAAKDAAKDATLDAAKDATLDAAKDVTLDAAKDATLDAAKDATLDAAKDATLDAAKDAAKEGGDGWRFVDADDFHSPENRARMAAGQPLDDAARAPWLAALAEAIDGWLAAGASVVLACSALRRSYRAVLRRDPARVRFVYLRVPEPVLAARLAARRDHFMPATLLASQLASLEAPGPDEDALVVDAAAPPALLVARIRAGLAASTPGSGF